LAEFLGSSLPDLFGEEVMLRSVVLKLLSQTVVEEIEMGSILYKVGKSSPNFTLLVDGKVQVVNARGDLLAERQAPAYWGINTLTQGMFSPDFTLIATQQSKVLKISKRAYNSALNASRLERELQTQQ